MQKQKILIFIDWFLPGTKSGGPVRSCSNLIDHLGEEIDFMVITRDRDYCETETYKSVTPNKWNNLNDHLKVFYISEENLNKNFLKNLINSIDFDTAYINGLYSKFFSIFPVYLLRNSNKPVIVAARGMLNSQAFSVKPLKKKMFFSLMNLVKFYKNVNFHATNEDEAEFIKKAIRNYKNIKVAPNLPRKIEAGGFEKRAKREPVTIISVARVAKEKGTLTALRAFSQIKTHHKITYDIYGPIYDVAYWKDCKEAIEKLPPNIQVNYEGSVEGDIVPELLNHYHFFIMPSEGENFGHGILEALTAGCPVLISDRTPWKDLNVKKIGWDCALNSNDLKKALGEAINMDEETYWRWSRNAFNFALEHRRNPETLEANKNLFLK